MDKQDLLIEYCISELVEIIAEQKDISYIQAMNMLYQSKFLDKLCDKETKLYRESSDYLYEIFSKDIFQAT
ncbi:MAG: hypothetical protein IJV56_05815 [Neisseriaceae bacterium]|nr:hypothetical protein [Neisseriaceae bacterium]